MIKICRKCNSTDFIIDHDEYPQCIQCGWIDYQAEIKPTVKKPLMDGMRLSLLSIPFGGKKGGALISVELINIEYPNREKGLKYETICLRCNNDTIMKQVANKEKTSKTNQRDVSIASHKVILRCRKQHRIQLFEDDIGGLVGWLH